MTYRIGNTPLYYLCCVERVLLLFGLHQASLTVRSLIECGLSRSRYPAPQLRQVLENLPSTSHWAGRVLDSIRCRLETIQQSITQHGHCVCGSKNPECITHHNYCLYRWVYEDAALRHHVGLTFLHRPAKGKMFAKYCNTASRTRIENWALQVEDVQPLPYGILPPEHSVVGDPTKSISVYRQLGLHRGGYRLEWSDKNGGCYLEAECYQVSTSIGARRCHTSEVSRRWLLSRGYRGGGQDKSKVQSVDEDSQVSIRRRSQLTEDSQHF